MQLSNLQVPSKRRLRPSCSGMSWRAELILDRTSVNLSLHSLLQWCRLISHSSSFPTFISIGKSWGAVDFFTNYYYRERKYSNLHCGLPLGNPLTNFQLLLSGKTQGNQLTSCQRSWRRVDDVRRQQTSAVLPSKCTNLQFFLICLYVFFFRF